MYDDERTTNSGNNILDNTDEQHVMENQVSFDEYNKIKEKEAETKRSYFDKTERTESMAEAAEERKRAPYEPIKDTYYKESVKHKKGTGFKKVLAACLVISLFGGVGIGASYSVMQNLVFGGGNTQKSTPELEVQNTTGTTIAKAEAVSSSSGGAMTAVDVIESVSPAVVNINTEVHGTTNYYGFMVPYEGSGSGSGVIFDSDAENVYILTNNHVVSGANQVSISVTGADTIPATIVGTDSTADIAVLCALRSDFKSAGIEEITVAKFGNSDELKVGESVIAIGNALGEGKSATGGMISILNKNIEIEGINLNVIQTSAAINKGNSGGALVNYSGEIVGINTAKTSTTVAEAMGYAIPSNTALEVAERLLEEGTTPRPYIGIMGTDITEDISSMYRLPVGVLVVQVTEGAGAANAGLQENDIIVSVNGKSTMDMESLTAAISELEIGSSAEVGIIRNGETPMTLNIEIMDANNIAANN